MGAGEFSSEDSPQSLEEFAGENLTEENLQESILEPIQTAIENSQANPQSTPDNIAVAVEDTGMGIPEEDAKRVFDTFVRGNRVLVREVA